MNSSDLQQHWWLNTVELSRKSVERSRFRMKDDAVYKLTELMSEFV